jgi:carbon storage regulator
MLVLSRFKDEVIVIGNGLVRVTVVDIRGDKVRLGFDADSSVAIHREEVWKAIEEGKLDAEHI